MYVAVILGSRFEKGGNQNSGWKTGSQNGEDIPS